MVVSDDWGEYGSFNISPYAVVKVDGGSLSDDYYQLAIKFMTYTLTIAKKMY